MLAFSRAVTLAHRHLSGNPLTTLPLNLFADQLSSMDHL